MGFLPYVPSEEAYFIAKFWRILYLIALVTTFFRYYYKRQFVDLAAYRKHRYFWWIVIIMASLMHLSVALKFDDYACLDSLDFCEAESLPFTVGLVIVTVFGPANRQNPENKGEEGVAVLFLISIFLFCADNIYNLAEKIANTKYLNIIPQEHFYVIAVNLISFGSAIIVTLSCYALARMAGWESWLIGVSKSVLFYLSFCPILIYVFLFFYLNGR